MNFTPNKQIIDCGDRTYRHLIGSREIIGETEMTPYEVLIMMRKG